MSQLQGKSEDRRLFLEENENQFILQDLKFHASRENLHQSVFYGRF